MFPAEVNMSTVAISATESYWLDINAARAHIANDPAIIGGSLGAHYLGENVSESFI